MDGNNIANKVVIREYDEERDIKVVGNLVKKCEITGSTNEEVSIFTNMHMMGGDPLCRIRFYPVHVMLVAELGENEELVGVVRGCIKRVGTRFGGSNVRLGCILGLRVSPRHRRKGIGLKLVKSVEEWLIGHGAQYTFLATEKNNEASSKLFTSKCNYTNFCSLVIFVQPASLPAVKGLSQNIKIEKLQIDQAISLYKSKFQGKDIYPADIDAILKEKLSMGTWVSYFKEEEWNILNNMNEIERNHEDMVTRTTASSSWAMFSIWNSCEPSKFHIRKSQYHPLKYFHATISLAKDKMFPCLKLPIACDSLQKPFGFLFLYGLHGEGERLQELMKSIWGFASRLAENVKDCKVIITELGVSDPLIQHVPRESPMSCINDLWYLKPANGLNGDSEEVVAVIGQAGNVFVDPRDF